MPNKKPYDVCPNCGAYLDHGERCDCDEDYQFVAQEAAKRDMHLERSSYNGRREPLYYLVDHDGNKVILTPLRICVLKDEFSPCEYVEYDPEIWREGINILLDKMNTWQLERVIYLVQDIWMNDKYRNPRPTNPHIYAKELQPERIYRKVDRRK